MNARDRVAAAFDAAAALDDPAVFVALADRDAALAALDAAGPDAPLAGLTLAVKDNIDVAGLPTTAACAAYAYRPERSATVVDRLVAAGATVVGKTNLDQFATGLVGTRSPFGTPRNPLDAALVPGGSSSGSAVAVARGVCDLALGTDTAGSGRVPAAMCGVVGLKPTRGWLSCTGVVPAVRSVDCVSVFGADVPTAWRALVAAAGPDPADPHSRRRPAGSGRDARRVGVPRTLDLDGPADQAAFAAAVDRVAAAGLEPVEVDLDPFVAAGRELYGGAHLVERLLAFGDVLDAHPDDADPTVAAIVGAVRSMSALDAARSAERLAGHAAMAARVWDDVDVLLVPTVPGPVTVEAVAADPIGVNARLGTLTSFTNLLDLCAMAVPVAGHGPRGVQVMAPAWSDATAAAVAHALHAGSSSVASVGAPAVEPATLDVVVVGAHLSGLPLNHQLTDRGARLVRSTTTAPAYRLYALGGFDPPRPGLVHVGADGSAIEVEVWRVPVAEVGGFLAGVPAPLALGTVELVGGEAATGFVCEPRALAGAADVSHHGGWRAFLGAAG